MKRLAVSVLFVCAIVAGLTALSGCGKKEESIAPVAPVPYSSPGPGESVVTDANADSVFEEFGTAGSCTVYRKLKDGVAVYVVRGVYGVACGITIR